MFSILPKAKFNELVRQAGILAAPSDSRWKLAQSLAEKANGLGTMTVARTGGRTSSFTSLFRAPLNPFFTAKDFLKHESKADPGTKMDSAEHKSKTVMEICDALLGQAARLMITLDTIWKSEGSATNLKTIDGLLISRCRPEHNSSFRYNLNAEDLEDEMAIKFDDGDSSKPWDQKTKTLLIKLQEKESGKYLSLKLGLINGSLKAQLSNNPDKLLEVKDEWLKALNITSGQFN